MKKPLLFLFLILSVVNLSACISKEESNNDMSSIETVIDVINNNSGEIDELGIKLYATNITPTGLTLVCTQAGGNIDGELQTDNLYRIEKEIDGVWEKIKLQENVYWEDEVLKVNEGKNSEWDIDWTTTYGELSAGEYRIGKKFIDFESQKEYSSYFCYVEFSIE